jgi:hypothetical protein
MGGLHRLPYHPHQIVAEGALLREAEVLSREPLLEMMSTTLSALTL